MGEAVVLGQLCTICRCQIPKYECPRCGTKTCSVPCVKKHKQRAQCNGRRDPTAYVKKAQLATPRGFDHDYNYLTGLERTLDRADRDAQDMGLGEDANGDRRVEKRVAELDIRWRRAPKGMSRQKENPTRWRHKQNCMRWGIEWIFPDDSRKVDGALETFTLAAAYGEVQSPYTINQRKQQKRASKNAQDEARQQSKRRRSRQSQDLDRAEDEKELSAVLQANAQHLTQIEHEAGGLAHSEQISGSRTPPFLDSAEADTVEDESSEVEIITEPSTNSHEQIQMYFYLLQPFTRGASKVLRPVSERQTLAEVLRGQEIFEFPTIYALDQGPDSLPEGLLLDGDYDADTKKMIEEVDTELRVAGVDTEALARTPKAATQWKEPGKGPSDASIVESLHRDALL
ncbi:MAG: hypothetical protein Q9162_005066 [Coniocarpon cinnabarinum]